MKKLTKEQIIMLHSELIRKTGEVDGLIDEGLLDSALNAPFQGFGEAGQSRWNDNGSTYHKYIYYILYIKIASRFSARNPVSAMTQ